MVSRDDVIAEARALASWKGVDVGSVDAALARLAPHLDVYAELVVTEHGIEVITGGVGADAAHELAALAGEHGASSSMVDAFLALSDEFKRIAQQFADAEPAHEAQVARLAADLPIERIELTSREEPL